MMVEYFTLTELVMEMKIGKAGLIVPAPILVFKLVRWMARASVFQEMTVYAVAMNFLKITQLNIHSQ
jgi:hypothetical protein